MTLCIVDLQLHKQISEINEGAVMVKLDPLLRHSESVPVDCYESVIDMVEGGAVMQFVKLNYALVTEVRMHLFPFIPLRICLIYYVPMIICYNAQLNQTCQL